MPTIWTTHSLKIQQRAYFVYGKEFLRASTKARKGLVQAHLLGHALELLLKTYLLTRGASATELKTKFRHDLAKLAARCQAEGLLNGRLSPALLSDIQQFNAAYKSEALRYFSLLHLLSPPSLPDLSKVKQYARSVSEFLDSTLKAA